MPRRHGCQAPWRPAQVASLLVWFSTVAGFYALFIPVLPSAAWQTTTAVLYTIATAAVFCTYLAVSCTDPADDSTDGPLYCDYCQAFVQQGSRHCKECQKCVLGFDHHCKWVNNCIGAKNYRTFLVLLTAMCAMLVVQLAVGIDDLVECFTASDDMSARLRAAYPLPVSPAGYIAALFCYLAVVAVVLYGLGDLWLLHLVLIARKMTTYDYIMANHDAALAAAAAGVVQPSPSLLAFSWNRLRSLGPRSIRVRDESVVSNGPTGSSDSSRRSKGALALPSHKHRVSLTPCQACLTPRSAIDARQHAAAYQQPYGSSRSGSSLPASPRTLPRSNTHNSTHELGVVAAFSPKAGGFDAAATFCQPPQPLQPPQPALQAGQRQQVLPLVMPGTAHQTYDSQAAAGALTGASLQQAELPSAPTACSSTQGHPAAQQQGMFSQQPSAQQPLQQPQALQTSLQQQQQWRSSGSRETQLAGLPAGAAEEVQASNQRMRDLAAAGHRPSVKFADDAGLP